MEIGRFAALKVNLSLHIEKFLTIYKITVQSFARQTMKKKIFKGKESAVALNFRPEINFFIFLKYAIKLLK